MFLWISHAIQIIINVNGRDCRSSLSTSVLLILGLKIFDHLHICFKMDCEKQKKEWKSAVIMLRFAM